MKCELEMQQLEIEMRKCCKEKLLLEASHSSHNVSCKHNLGQWQQAMHLEYKQRHRACARMKEIRRRKKTKEIHAWS